MSHFYYFNTILLLFVFPTTPGAGHTTAAVLQYFGARIGRLSELNHGVSGEVFAVDSRTLFIKNFNYDGIGPAAYFYVGTSSQPSNPPNAWRVRDERGNPGVLRGYRNKDITLSLPEGKTLRDIKWFSVWCEDYAVSQTIDGSMRHLHRLRSRLFSRLGLVEVSYQEINCTYHYRPSG